MTTQEAAKIIFTIRATYPGTYKNMPAALIEEQVAVWAGAFRDVPYSTVSAALMAYIRGADSSYPPAPADINRLIATETKPGYPYALEAWTMVYKAICNSGYNSEEEYAKLPPMIQKAIGSAANLREMSQMPVETVESVEQSHFIRAYETMVKRAERDAMIPQAMHDAIKTSAQDVLEEYARKKELSGD